MGGGSSKSVFSDIVGGVGDLLDGAVSSANFVGSIMEDSFDEVVDLAKDISKIGGILLKDTWDAAQSAGRKYSRALVREAKNKGNLIKQSAVAVASEMKDTYELSERKIVSGANNATNKIKGGFDDFSSEINDTTTTFANEMKEVTSDIKDGMNDFADKAEGELNSVINTTGGILEDALDFMTGRDWFDLQWANKFLNNLFGVFNKVTSIKMTKQSDKKPVKKNSKDVEFNSENPDSTSKIPNYKAEPELVKNGKLQFSMINEEKENFSVIERKFNRKKIFILILLLILLILFICVFNS